MPKKTDQKEQEEKESIERARAVLSDLWLSQESFLALFRASGIVPKIAELYRDEWISRWHEQPWNKGKDSAKIESTTQAISEIIKEQLSKRFYYTTTLLIYQAISASHGRPMSKSKANRLLRVFFVENGLTGLRLRDSRGRTRKVALDATEDTIKKAVLRFKEKNKGKIPTLAQVAKVMQISTSALKMRISRESLNWKGLRKVTK